MWIKKWISLAQFTILSTQSIIIVHLSMCCSLCTCMREYAGINAHQQIQAHGHNQFSHVLLAHLSWTMHSCTSYICKASLRCVFSYVLSHTLSQMIQSCTGFICQTSPNALLVKAPDMVLTSTKSGPKQTLISHSLNPKNKNFALCETVFTQILCPKKIIFPFFFRKQMLP